MHAVRNAAACYASNSLVMSDSQYNSCNKNLYNVFSLLF